MEVAERNKQMNIALHDADNTKFPNLALMKLSAWHKSVGNKVSTYKPLMTYDIIYTSKVFTFTDTKKPNGSNVIWGGTGYNSPMTLSEKCEHICPDYEIYNCEHSYGFLTRGCIRKCKECVVPEKEGNIKPHADIEEFLRHKSVVLLDNNVLAHSHGVDQIDKMARLGIKVDFNQGLDARLIDDSIAKKLSRLKWLKPLRLACDSQSSKKPLHKAVELLRWHNVTPRKYFVYMLVRDIDEAFDRASFIKGLYCDPWAQPYISMDGEVKPTNEQKDFARWCNFGRIFNAVPWKDYRKRNDDKQDKK